MLWKSRQQAGEQLGRALKEYRKKPNTTILGLPRGGVIVAAEIARSLHLPLDIIVVRKIGAPFNEELAIGAIDETGHGFFNANASGLFGLRKKYLQETISREQKEAARRLRAYRGSRPPLDLTGETAILVDDGVATGHTMRAAISSCRSKGATNVVVAVPVIAPDTIPLFEREADKLVYLEAPTYFSAVGQFYKEFEQVEDAEVKTALR